MYAAGTFLVAVNPLHLLLVAFGNITDFAANQVLAQHVLSMDTTNFGRRPVRAWTRW